MMKTTLLYFQIIPFAAVLSEKGIISMESICQALYQRRVPNRHYMSPSSPVRTASRISLSLITFRSLTKKLLNFHVFYPRVASYQREQSTFRIYPPLLIWGNKGSHVVTEKFSIYKLFTLSMYNHSIFYSSIQEWHHINESSQLSGFITTIDTLRHTGKSSCTHLIMTVFITHVSRQNYF